MRLPPSLHRMPELPPSRRCTRAGIEGNVAVTVIGRAAGQRPLHHQCLQGARDPGAVDPDHMNAGCLAFRCEFPPILVAMLIQHRPTIQLSIIERSPGLEVEESQKELGMKQDRLGLTP